MRAQRAKGKGVRSVQPRQLRDSTHTRRVTSGLSMFPALLKLECVVLFALLSVGLGQAQTPSSCRPAPPLPANPKPAVNGLTVSSDGKTLVVAGGDAKI